MYWTTSEPTLAHELLALMLIDLSLELIEPEVILSGEENCHYF
jgi:hypothetical protein